MQQTQEQAATGAQRPPAGRIAIIPVGHSLGVLLAVSYVLCVGFDLILPSQAMHAAWEPYLPWFTWLTWPSFFLGLIEAFAYGWYIALVFGLTFNWLAARRA